VGVTQLLSSLEMPNDYLLKGPGPAQVLQVWYTAWVSSGLLLSKGLANLELEFNILPLPRAGFGSGGPNSDDDTVDFN